MGGIAGSAVPGVESAKKLVQNEKGSGNVGTGNVINKNSVEWTAPARTKQTYKVYQRMDIDWDLVRTGGNKRFIGKTNYEAARVGVAPELGNGSRVPLHHMGQNSKGPIVEISREIHDKYHKILHSQYGPNKPHPEFPVDHGSKWQSDVREYWKWRAKNAK